MLMSLSDVVKGGDLRLSLRAQRDDLARRIEEAENRDAAALHRQLAIVLEKLDRLPGGEEVTELDRIAGTVTDEMDARRTRRRAGAAGAGGAAGG